MKKIALVALAAGLVLPALASAQSIGPDSFGYTLTRTNNPAFFTTIQGAAGTVTVGTGDDNSFAVVIPSFSLYGTARTAANVTTNGFISFGGTSAPFTNADLNTNLGAPNETNPFLAPYWDDLFSPPGAVFQGSRTVGGHQQTVFEWNEAYFDSQAGPTVTFQTILQDDGTIFYVYNSVSAVVLNHANGGSATIGIRDASGETNGRVLQWDFNGSPNLINDGDLITITRPVPEPTSLALVGVGAVGLVWRRYRRKA